MLDKLQKLKEVYSQDPQDREFLRSISSRIKRETIKVSFAKHQGTKLIPEEVEKQIENINVVLTHAETLTEAQRESLVKERKVYTWLLELVDPKKAQQRIDALEKLIDDKHAAITQ